MDLMHAFADDIKRYRDAENIEIELRIGRIFQGKFSTDVGPHIFANVLGGLEAYTGWEAVTELHDEVYYWGGGIGNSSTVRCRYSEQGSFTERKNAILKKDLKIGPVLDVRLGISQEIPCEMPSEDATRAIQRRRKSFLRKNVRIDMTVVTGTPVDKDSESIESYQIELEILSARTDQEIFSALHKVHDLFKLVTT